MSESDQQGTQQQQPDPPADDTPSGVHWGTVLDVAGVIAGVLLMVIVADIWSDGRLISRRLLRGGQEQPEPAPDAE